MSYKESKQYIRCPVCGERAELFHCSIPHYKCTNLYSKCGWESFYEYNGKRTLDIYSGDFESGCLSNLFPYNFVFYMKKYDAVIECNSMENFIQGLKIENPSIQKEFCKTFSGLNCVKFKVCFNDWRKDGFVYLNGHKIKRNSLEYDEVITRAYDCLYEGNHLFREYAIPYASKFYLIHSIGKEYTQDTLLTENEFISQLNRLIKKYKATNECN